MAKRHQDKLITLILSECARAPERTGSYQSELVQAIADVVKAERDHALRSTDIQKQITGICERLGDFVTGIDSIKGKTKRKP